MSVGYNFAIQVPSSSHRFTEYLSPNNHFRSPILISNVRFCRFLKARFMVSTLSCAKHIVSGPLTDIFNTSVQKGSFPSKLKEAKVIPVYKSDDETEPGNYRLKIILCDRYFGNMADRNCTVELVNIPQYNFISNHH